MNCRKQGVLPCFEMRLQGCAVEIEKTHFPHFSVPRPYLSQNHTTFPNFLLKMPHFGKFSIPSPKSLLKSSSQSVNLDTNYFWKQHFVKEISTQVPEFGTDLIYKPPFSARRAAHPYPVRDWVPLPPPMEFFFPSYIQWMSGTNFPEMIRLL